MQQHFHRGFTGITRALSLRSLCSAMLFTITVLSTHTAVSDTRVTALESLSPTKEHREATEVITHLMQRYHYSQVDVDDDLSIQIFDRYLDSFDPQKAFFLASDIESFKKYRLEFDDKLRDSDLDPIFEIFKLYRARVEERANFAKQLLTQEFDFSIDESYTFNREEAEWLPSQEAANELWRKRVKNDMLNLRLSDRSEEDVTQTLRDRYDRMERRISQLSANEVFQFFINSYTLSVEPHTSYFSPRSSENFRINMSLSLEGIGAALRTENEYTVVQRVIPGGPAALSEKISADDRIIGVGGDDEIVDVVSWPLSDVVDLIRGPKGSTIQLKIVPGNAPEGSPPEIITLVRDEIKLEEQAAKSLIVDVPEGEKTQRFGVIDLPTFYLDSAAMSQGKKDFRSTTRDVKRLVTEMTSEGDGVDGIVIDLRGNGGGSLFEATQLTGLFIESGPVVQIRNARGQVDTQEDEDPSVVYDGPLAVLVDRNSASASEIFAAAIQDYGRGVILGEPTFGKGTVQTVAPLDREGKLGQLKITTAQFFRVNGEGTQFRGVVPDVLFPTALHSDAQGERGLDNALPWAEVAAADYSAWSTDEFNFDAVQAQHESRYRVNDSFTLLIEELDAQLESSSRNSISLNEEIRRQEIEEQEANREERIDLFRKAFGASSPDEDDSDSTSSDILLVEAANVLSDIIEARAASNP